MRFAILLMALAACGVEKNPDVCCATGPQCESLGLDPTDLRPCGDGQACAEDHTCVASDCTVSDDCPTATPVCATGLCVATCTADPDCPTALPHCDAGACVACTDDSQCPASAAICDADTNACRGCTADAECANGVCIEDTGVCATGGEIIYVGAYATSTDAGDCPAAVPCQSIAYAFTRVTTSRNVIRLLADTAYLGDASARLIAGSATIDGAPTQLSGHGLDVDGANLIVENVTYAVGANGIIVGDEGALTLAHATVTASAAQSVVVSGSSTLTVHDSTVSGPGFSTTTIGCSNGFVVLARSAFHGASTIGMGCDVQAARCTFVDSRVRLETTGRAELENDLVISSVGDDILVDTKEASPGSYVRFLTFVNQSPVSQSQAALYCSDNVDVSSCLFAYNSRDPVDYCTPHDSLFDTPSAPDPHAAGNDIEDPATFFVGGGDYHLAPAGPAIGHGEPGLVTEDLDGNPRGAMPDIGAYEAP